MFIDDIYIGTYFKESMQLFLFLFQYQIITDTYTRSIILIAVRSTLVVASVVSNFLGKKMSPQNVLRRERSNIFFVSSP